MYCVYLLESLKDKSHYTGFTTNLDQRIREHNEGKVAYSSAKRPFRLVWHCFFEDKIKALEFERYLKSGSGFAFARKRFI